MNKIRDIAALEILDSRGNPTLSVTVELDDGSLAKAAVPSGASTGLREAVELRDGDLERYGGKGVLHAVANVNGELAERLKGMEVAEQRKIDDLMREMDGTENKSRLGANAILGVSMAVCRAAAQSQDVPLYAWLRELSGEGNGPDYLLPAPMMNVLNGGAHALNNLDFQEFMLFPLGAPNFTEALRYGAEIFQTLKRLLHARGLTTSVGDEGGFAPDLPSNEDALTLIVDAIERGGFRPGEDVSIAVDPAASEFFHDERYVFRKGGGAQRTAAGMGELYLDLVRKFPIASLEDGMAENDREGWLLLTGLLGKKMQLVGDDNFVTNPKIFAEGIKDGIANAILIKLNQIGTVTETLDCIRIAKKANYRFVISHRSGETEDTFVADLAVGAGSGQIKTGSLCRSERVAKYNRLLAIEHELGENARYGGASLR
ncbi:MAG: phosphopyruvate hydratase [Rhodanobacteraceae bacterium]